MTKFYLTEDNLRNIVSEMNLQLSYIETSGNKYGNVKNLRELINKLNPENVVFVES